MEGKKTQSEKKKAELLDLKASLDDRKQILLSNRQTKNRLLSATKNKTSNYEKEHG